MKFENNWQYKSLENLEKEYWGDSDNVSPLVTRCHQLRKLPLNQFTIEDLGVMIRQKIGLFHLIPFALEKLRDNIVAEGIYPGDLLEAVRKVDRKYWHENPTNLTYLNELIKSNAAIINKVGLSPNVLEI